MLRERRDSFRKGYRAWRQGRAHGARGEVATIGTDPTTQTRNFPAGAAPQVRNPTQRPSSHLHRGDSSSEAVS